MAKQKQEGEPELTQSILDIDYTPSHIAELLSAQTNDQERYTLAEKLILDLINKNNERTELLNERKELLEHRDKLLHEQENLLHEREQLRGKIQALEHQLQAVEGDPRATNKQTPAFIQIPDTKANSKYFECIEIVKKYSDLQSSHTYNAKLLKSRERAEIIEKLTKARAEYPVTNYKDMRNTIHWLQQKLHTNSLHACANILDPRNEGKDLYQEWQTYWTNLSEEGRSAVGAKVQASMILAEILRNIFSKDNPVMALKFHHAYAKIPEDILGVYAYQIIKDQFPQATLDVIVRDIIKVLMFSLQASKYTTFDHWYRSFMKEIEDLNLLYGEITWEQTYLAIVMWALELMDDRYKLLRQHMKLRLPSDTKGLLKNPNEALDNVIKMVTQWDTQSMSYRKEKGIQQQDYKQKTFNIICNMLDLPLRNDTSTDEACPYCKKFNHTLKQCWVKKSDEHLKDEVEELIPSLKKIYKAQHDLLQQKERLTMDQEKLMRSILHTLQGMTIGGNRIKDLMDNDKQHQGEKIKSKENASARTQPRNLQFRGRVPEPHTTRDREDQEYEEGDHLGSEQAGQRPTYDYDQDYQEHDESQNIPQNEEEDDDGYQDNNDEGDNPYHQDDQQESDQERFYNQDDQQESDQEGSYNQDAQQESDQEESYDQDDRRQSDQEDEYSTSGGGEYDEGTPEERDHEAYISWSMQVTH